MEAAILSIMSAVIASIIAFLFQVIFNKAAKANKEIKQSEENSRLALQALLRTELRRYGKIYLNKGWIDDADKDDYNNLYERYHNLGKNGVMDDMYNKVMKLPTTKNLSINQTTNPKK